MHISELSDDEKRLVPLDLIDLPIRVISVMVNLRFNSTTKKFDHSFEAIRNIPPGFNNVTTLGELLDLLNTVSDSQLLKRLPNFGTKSLDEIHQLLEAAFPSEFRGSNSEYFIRTPRYTYKEQKN